MPRFDGTSGPDAIDGTSDADVIKGYAGDDTLNGLGGDDDIDGGDDNDTIDGGTGADFMAGQAGNDTYYVDNANDRVAESPGFGSDRVYTTVDYVVPNYVELMAVTDPRSTFAVNLYGNGDANTIYGNDGANVIDGRVGADTMYGQGGDDAYYVDHAGDIVKDHIVAGNDGGNNDIIFTTVSYSLGQLTGEYVERLAVFDPTTTTDLILNGNDLDNEITGNDGNNRLDGRGGSDILRGLGGNDTYILHFSGVDTAIEHENGGYDTVMIGGSYTLLDNFEALLGGVSANTTGTLTGNAHDNLIRGSDGNEIIDGRAGADHMLGGRGNDAYFVDNLGDFVDEGPTSSGFIQGDGLDIVFTTVDFTLTRYIERVAVNDTASTQSVNLTGSELANELSGNDGANVLNGKLGLDTLIGYGGADTFAFTTVVDGHNADLFLGFEAGVDKVALDDAVFAGLTPGALPAEAFVVGRFATDADDRILYEASTGDLFFDRDGTGPIEAQYFASLADGLSLTASDFIVI